MGHLVVVSGAIRDEGVSYHYLPASREVIANEAGVNALVNILNERGLPLPGGENLDNRCSVPGNCHTRSKSDSDEGCLTVEMESAALIAVAQFRNVIFGQALYGGDDLSGAEWDHRQWQSRSDIRESLFWLCADACLGL